MQPPCLDQSIAHQIDLIHNGIVVPKPKETRNTAQQASGVLHNEGRFVENSVTWRNKTAINTRPERPSEDQIETLRGSYMFAGMLFGHFGHFLVESIARLWALEQIKDKIDGVVFTPKSQNLTQLLMRQSFPTLQVLGLSKPALNLDRPARVEKLYVPQQGFGMFEMIKGAPEFRAYVQMHCGRYILPDGPKKLYISRSGLPVQRGGMLGEKLLEKLLAAEGYVTYHPQKHSFQDQVATYKAATEIISIDGSPLHLLALVGNPNQRVACIARRAGNLDLIFATQLQAFQSIETTTISALIQDWIPETTHRPSRLSYGEVDFAEIYKGLYGNGFIKSGSPWKALTDNQINSLVADIETAQNLKFNAFPGVKAAS